MAVELPVQLVDPGVGRGKGQGLAACGDGHRRRSASRDQLNAQVSQPAQRLVRHFVALQQLCDDGDAVGECPGDGHHRWRVRSGSADPILRTSRPIRASTLCPCREAGVKAANPANGMASVREAG